MPCCPDCSIEYVEGTSHCEQCGAILLPGPPPEAHARVDLRHEKNVKLVPVRIFGGGTAQMDADLARNILEAQGIPSLALGGGAADVLPVLDVPLLVREEHLDKAARILEDFFDTEATAGKPEGEPSGED